MIVTQTDRLTLRHIAPADAPFVHALLTDPDFLAQIGDRGGHTLADAERVIVERFEAGYAERGFGMFLVERSADGAKLGMCGLVKRDGLESVDLGYAFLPAARGSGYALEAARAVLAWAAERAIAPVVAIVSPGNARSTAVLERLGYTLERSIRLPGADHDVLLFIPAQGNVRSG